jgi:hypothetical protein
MSKELESPNLFNPMMLWTDLGMRALEVTLASSQNISDGVDRLARAGASPEANLEVLTSSTNVSAPAEDSATVAAPPGFAFVAQMQRTTLDLMTQGWQNWMSTLGALVSLGAGRTFGETVVRQNPLLNAMRESIQSGHEAQAAITHAASSSRHAGRQRERQADATEHGHAAAEPKRRSRSSRAKPKARSRNG